MTTLILPAEPFELGAGSHSNIAQGACFNELAAVLAGEPFSDAPACVSPVIRRIGMRLNDRLDDERRQRLRPFALRALGTAYDGRDEERRQMCTEWLLHHALPDLLDKAGKAEVAARLRSLPGDLAVEGVRRAIREARNEAFDARNTAIEKLKAEILKEFKKRKVAEAVAEAVAVAGAAAAAAAEAVAGAEAEAEAEAAAAAEAAAEAEAAAAAAAVAEAGAVAVAEAGDVAAAVAAAAAVAGAVAVAAAVAGAVAAAEAEAVAAAEAAAVAGAVAEAAAVAEADYWAIRNAVYKAVREKVEETFKPTGDALLDSALELFDRMLPPEPLQVPVIKHADVICAVAA